MSDNSPRISHTPDTHDSLESRLELLGDAAAHEVPTLDERGAFMEGVRRRGRTRTMRNTMIAGGGVSLAAAAVLLAAMLNPPRSLPGGVPPAPVGPVVAASVPQAPTMAELSRVAWGADGLDEFPTFDEGSGPIEEPWNAAAGSNMSAEELMGL